MSQEVQMKCFTPVQYPGTGTSQWHVTRSTDEMFRSSSNSFDVFEDHLLKIVPDNRRNVSLQV
jgi:hypothetical protein